MIILSGSVAAARRHQQAADQNEYAGIAADGMERLRKRLRTADAVAVDGAAALHEEDDGRDNEPGRRDIRPHGADNGKAGVEIKADLILQPAEKAAEGREHQRGDAKRIGAVSHNIKSSPIKCRRVLLYA